MPDLEQTVQKADHKLQQQTRRAADHPWVEKLARFGYAAKGIVYALIGVLAVQTAIGAGGATTGSQGALQALGQQPLARLLLGLIAVGLVGYVVWRLIQAALDTENKGSKPAGLAQRLGYVVSAFTYGGLAFAAARLALGQNSQDNTTGMTAQVMALPLGRVLVAIAGVIVLGIGGYQIFRAVTRHFEDELNRSEMSATERTWALRSGVVGLIAHGIVLGLTGLFLIVAAIQQQPEQAQGLGGALQALSEQPFGPYLLGVVALGLVAYGAFSLVEARYRRMIFS